jgi:hypothetical protein
MFNKADSAAQRRLSLIFLWLFVLLTAVGLGDALRRYYAPKPAPPPAEVRGRKLEPPTPQPAKTANPPQSRALFEHPEAASPATRQESHIPGVRHFEEHLSTETAASDTAEGWHDGRPVFSSKVIESDTSGHIEVYWLEDSSFVEYDRKANRYRKWVRDALEVPQDMEPLSQPHDLGDYETQ